MYSVCYVNKFMETVFVSEFATMAEAKACKLGMSVAGIHAYIAICL